MTTSVSRMASSSWLTRRASAWRPPKFGWVAYRNGKGRHALQAGRPAQVHHGVPGGPALVCFGFVRNQKLLPHQPKTAFLRGGRIAQETEREPVASGRSANSGRLACRRT